MRSAVQRINLYYPILVKIRFFWIKLPFIETVFPFPNRNLPQGTEVWPPGSLHINAFHYLKCGISIGEVLTDTLTKKQSLTTTIKEVFSSIPREDLKRACSRFQPRLEEVNTAKCDFIR
jgi:hypothetical protein